MPAARRTLSEFSVTIQDEVDPRGNAAIHGRRRRWAICSTPKKMALSLSSFTTVFEIDELMNLGEKFALPVLLYLFRRIERSPARSTLGHPPR
jgi:hypothetical protein